jgi:hypothetical protein
MTKTTSFQADIRPLFTERDIQGMSKAFNLGSYDDVKKHAGVSSDRIRGIGGAVMPPPPPKGEGPWQLPRIELFAKWMADGSQPQSASTAQGCPQAADEDWIVVAHFRSGFEWRIS